MEDGFGPFTMSQVRSAFNAFDLDRNTYVGAAELRHVYNSIGEEVTDEEIDEMIRMVDTDGDGQISFAEFSKMIFRYASQIDEPEPKPAIPMPDKPGDESARPFEFFMEEKKGVISTATSVERKGELEQCLVLLQFKSVEIKALLKRINEQPWFREKEADLDYPEFCDLLLRRPSAHMVRLFELFDPKGQQKVNAREFLVLISNYAGLDKDEQLLFAFQLFDVDNSKSLTRDELIQILKANYLADHIEQVQRKADSIMKQADKDGDGNISFDEFVSVCKRFPNLLFPTFEGRTRQ